MRRWALALGASAGIHLALVGLALWVQSSATRPSPPSAPPPPSVATRLAVQLIPTAGQAPSPLAARVRTKPRSLSPPSTGTPDPSPAPTEKVIEESAGSAQEAADGASASGGGQGERTDPAGGEADYSELARRLSLSASRCYPPAARRFRLQGQAEVSFCVGAAGALTQVTLLKSAGAAVLDRAALECVVPGALPIRAVEGCYSVPVRFVRP